MPGQWAGSTRAKRLPPDWHKIRARTWRAAGGRCQWTDADGQRCTTTTPLNKTGATPGGHCDHINREAGDTPDNYQWLCGPHHRAKTTHEGQTARPTERRPRPAHPGLA